MKRKPCARCGFIHAAKNGECERKLALFNGYRLLMNLLPLKLGDSTEGCLLAEGEQK